MARKTTCRSSCFVLLLGLTAAALPAAAQEAAPASHTVRAGDTLWDIARRYLGDPFSWPQIFRINTDVVEDPHWIYPGEVLRLRGGAGVSAVPDEAGAEPEAAAAGPVGPVPQAEPSSGEYPMPEFAQVRRTAVVDAIMRHVDEAYRPLRAGEFYSSGFLTEEQRLPFGRLLGAVTPQQIRNLSERASTTLYSQVGIRAPQGASYARGDSLLVVQLGDELRGYGLSVIPTGLVVITGEAENQYVADVVAVFGPMRNGQLVLPAEPFNAGPASRALPVADGMAGQVLGGRELRELKHPLNVLFISLGRGDGVNPGDLFEVRRRPGPRAGAADAVEEVMALGQVVRVGDRSATLLLLRVVSPDIAPGTPVVQVARLPVGADR